MTEKESVKIESFEKQIKQAIISTIKTTRQTDESQDEKIADIIYSNMRELMIDIMKKEKNATNDLKQWFRSKDTNSEIQKLKERLIFLAPELIPLINDQTEDRQKTR